MSSLLGAQTASGFFSSGFDGPNAVVFASDSQFSDAQPRSIFSLGDKFLVDVPDRVPDLKDGFDYLTHYYTWTAEAGFASAPTALFSYKPRIMIAGTLYGWASSTSEFANSDSLVIWTQGTAPKTVGNTQNCMDDANFGELNGKLFCLATSQDAFTVDAQGHMVHLTGAPSSGWISARTDGNKAFLLSKNLQTSTYEIWAWDGINAATRIQNTNYEFDFTNTNSFLLAGAVDNTAVLLHQSNDGSNMQDWLSIDGDGYVANLSCPTPNAMVVLNDFWVSAVRTSNKLVWAFEDDLTDGGTLYACSFSSGLGSYTMYMDSVGPESFPEMSTIGDSALLTVNGDAYFLSFTGTYVWSWLATESQSEGNYQSQYAALDSSLNVFRTNPSDSSISSTAKQTWGSIEEFVSVLGKLRPSMAPNNPTVSITSDTSAHVEWSIPSSHGSSAIRNYRVEYRDNDSNSAWHEVSHPASTDTSLDVTELQPGTSYTFRIHAVTNHGISIPAITQSVTTTGVKPAVPSSPTNLASVAVTTSSITVSWSDPESSGSQPITNYSALYIEYAKEEQVPWTTISGLAVNSRQFTISGLKAFTYYDIAVYATNSVGDSEWADIVVRTKGVVANAPTSLKGVPTKGKKGTITLTWKKPAITGSASIKDYKIEYSLDGKKWAAFKHKSNSKLATVTISKLTSKKKYTFRVSALTDVGTGKSALVKVTTA